MMPPPGRPVGGPVMSSGNAGSGNQNMKRPSRTPIIIIPGAAKSLITTFHNIVLALVIFALNFKNTCFFTSGILELQNHSLSLTIFSITPLFFTIFAITFVISYHICNNTSKLLPYLQ